MCLTLSGSCVFSGGFAKRSPPAIKIHAFSVLLIANLVSAKRLLTPTILKTAPVLPARHSYIPYSLRCHTYERRIQLVT